MNCAVIVKALWSLHLKKKRKKKVKQTTTKNVKDFNMGTRSSTKAFRRRQQGHWRSQHALFLRRSLNCHQNTPGKVAAWSPILCSFLAPPSLISIVDIPSPEIWS